jgi:aryl-alcohol dehydrogenase-like predicted oxidoreductase
MNTPPLTRRQVLAGGVAGVGALLAPWQIGAAVSTTLAAASGTVGIGGDLIVNRLGFGAMRITGPDIWGAPKDPAEARRVLHRALELGVNFIDTADAYGPYVSEQLIAEALYPYPRGLVIATKGGQVRPSASEWTPDGRPAHLREACEASLKRLRLERIDLYQFHRIDPHVPLEESVGELARLQKEGKIRHVGVSNFNVEELARARKVVSVVSVQNRYNVSDRASDDVLAVCARDRMVFIPWAPIARGSSDRLEREASGQRLEALAKTRGVSVLQLALAWLLAKSPAMLPIPGTSSVEHLNENVAAAQLKLTADEMTLIG